jgi:hypothetical protein
MLKVHDLAHFIIETVLGITVKNILVVRHFIENKKEVLESIMLSVHLMRKEIRVSCQKNTYDRKSK